MRRRALTGLAVVVLALLGAAGCAEESDGERVTVLAAASLTEAFTELADRFERDHPDVDLRLSFAASSELAAQVVNGAPADVFASASTETMHTVLDAGAAAGKPKVFARNQLQIAVPAGNPGEVTGLGDFARDELALVLCAPEVPCGAAAVELLELAGVEPSVDSLEPDVKAALAKVELGEADAALVYRTDVRAAGEAVTGLDVPEADSVVNDYPIVVLRGAADAADDFVDLVRSPAGRAVLVDAGFEQP